MKKHLTRENFPRVLSPALCLLSLCTLDFTLRYVYSFTGITPLLSRTPWAFTVLWAVLLTALCQLLPRLPRRILMGVMTVFFTLLALTHGVLYNVTGSFFSFSDLNFAGDGAKFFSFTYFHLRKAYWLGLLISVAFMAGAILTARKPGAGKLRWAFRGLWALAAIACCVGIFKVHTALLPSKDEVMWWGASTDTRAAVYEDFTDSKRSLMLTGLYQYTYRNLMVTLGVGAERPDTSELDAYFEARSAEISGENGMTGTLKGKNLMMVMLESIDTWLVTPAYMPNLYRITQEGVNFTNFYTPLYLSAGTFTTEIISQTGLIPPTSGISNRAYASNAFPLSLAHLFADEGYAANSFHPAYPSIYNRGSIHENLGFAAYHDFEDMGMDDYQLDSQMIRAYSQMVSADAPFFTYIITYSGHGPYTPELGNISAPHMDAAKAAVAASGVSGSEENMAEYTEAVAHAMETDAFIGELVAQLEADGLLEDTVLLFYTDHYGKYMSDSDFLRALKGAAAGSPELYRTPCVLYGGGLQPQTVEKLCGSVDIVPTIVNLFDLPVDRACYIGDDIFGDAGGIVMLPGYAWYDGTTYCADGEAATPEEQAVSAQVREKMTMSMDVYRTDYYKNRE